MLNAWFSLLKRLFTWFNSVTRSFILSYYLLENLCKPRGGFTSNVAVTLLACTWDLTSLWDKNLLFPQNQSRTQAPVLTSHFIVTFMCVRVRERESTLSFITCVLVQKCRFCEVTFNGANLAPNCQLYQFTFSSCHWFPRLISVHLQHKEKADPQTLQPESSRGPPGPRRGPRFN